MLFHHEIITILSTWSTDGPDLFLSILQLNFNVRISIKIELHGFTRSVSLNKITCLMNLFCTFEPS